MPTRCRIHMRPWSGWWWTTPVGHVNEVGWGTLSWGEERLKLRYADVCSSMWEESRSKALVGADVVEVCPEGAYQVVRRRAVVDVISPP